MSDNEIAPEDFGGRFHGVHLFEDEDGDWLAYGHHSARRVAAAMNACARHETLDLGQVTLDEVRAGMGHAWGNNVRRDGDGIWWDVCSKDAPGAFPLTVVRL